MATLTKIDHARELSRLYRAHKEPELVDVPPMRFLMVDGHGDPNDSETFREAVRALYAVAYGLKFAVRRLDAIDYKVMPLEGLWWIPNARVWDFEDKSDWDWTLMVMQPASSPTASFARWSTRASRRRSRRWTGSASRRFEEGAGAQILHTGPFSEERPTLERLHGFIRGQGLIPVGKHHEIYLSDPGRTRPERLRAILRQPGAQRFADGEGASGPGGAPRPGRRYSLHHRLLQQLHRAVVVARRQDDAVLARHIAERDVDPGVGEDPGHHAELPGFSTSVSGIGGPTITSVSPSTLIPAPSSADLRAGNILDQQVDDALALADHRAQTLDVDARVAERLAEPRTFARRIVERHQQVFRHTRPPVPWGSRCTPDASSRQTLVTTTLSFGDAPEPAVLHDAP